MGQIAEWGINHWRPDDTDEEEGHIYVVARRNLRTGGELFFDYRLEAEGRRTKKLERDFACYCGTPRCRGAMLEPLE